MRDKNGLTFKQAAFCDNYITTKGNSTQAARLAGYKGNDNTLAQTGLKLVRNGKVKVAIERRMAEMAAENSGPPAVVLDCPKVIL